MGKASKSFLKGINILQKKSLRIINKAQYNAHTNSLFHIMKILKIDELYELQVAKTMYRNNISKLPQPLQKLFTPHTQMHNYNTRNKDNPLVPLHRLAIDQNSIARMGPLIWTEIPKEVKNSLSLNTLKFKFKKKLLARYALL